MRRFRKGSPGGRESPRLPPARHHPRTPALLRAIAHHHRLLHPALGFNTYDKIALIIKNPTKPLPPAGSSVRTNLNRLGPDLSIRSRPRPNLSRSGVTTV